MSRNRIPSRTTTALTVTPGETNGTAPHQHRNGDVEPFFGSHLVSKNTYRVLRSESSKAEIDNKFILAVAHGGQKDESTRVRSYHTSVFITARGGDLSVLKRVESDIAKNLIGIGRHIVALSRALHGTVRHHDILRHNEPWAGFDVIRAAVCGLLMLICTAAGANTLAQIMVGSYVAGFENYSRNLLFSFLVVAFPIVIECFINRTFGEIGKKWMRASVAILAMLSFGFWVWSFAQTFSISGASAADLATALVNSVATNPEQKINTLTIFQILSEVLVAGICALELQHLFEIHRLSDRITNPQFSKTQADLATWLKLQREEEELLGNARGRIQEIEEELKTFVDKAVALYGLARTAAEQHLRAIAILNSK
jgi:hypothetical protein